MGCGPLRVTFFSNWTASMALRGCLVKGKKARGKGDMEN